MKSNPVAAFRQFSHFSVSTNGNSPDKTTISNDISPDNSTFEQPPLQQDVEEIKLENGDKITQSPNEPFEAFVNNQENSTNFNKENYSSTQQQVRFIAGL